MDEPADWTLDELLEACGDDDLWSRLLGDQPSLSRCRAVADDLKTLGAQYVQDLAEENERLVAARGERVGGVTKRTRKKGSNLTSQRRQQILREQALVVERQREIRPLIRDHSDRVNADLTIKYRSVIARMAQEIAEHQEARGEAGDEIDETLWRVLDEETVVYGPESDEVPLRFMIDEVWNERPARSTREQPSPSRPGDTASPVFLPPR